MTESEKIIALSEALGAGTVEERSLGFANSLLFQYRDHGMLSPKQWTWVEKLAAGPEERQEDESVHVAEMVDLFDRASENLRWPKIAIPTDGAKRVQFSLAGPRAKHPGTINVTDGGRYPDNKWYGRIHRDGRWELNTNAVTLEIIKLVKRFSLNPAGVAAEAGAVTGHCVFCQKKLTDERSVSVGYGSTCAGNYGLEWGYDVAA